MRAVFGIASLLITLAIVGVVVKKQLTATTRLPTAQASGTVSVGGVRSPIGPSPETTGPIASPPAQPSQLVQQQYQQALESAMQPARRLPDEADKP